MPRHYGHNRGNLNAERSIAQRASHRIRPHLDRRTGSRAPAQVRDLKAAGCTKIFQRTSLCVGERGELDRALDYVRGGDTLVVTKVDRLARSTAGLWEIVKRLEAIDDGGAGLRVLNLGGETVDTKSATGKLILTIFAGFAQFEREMMLERQREGIAKAKAEKRYLGRKPSARLKADDAVQLFKQGRTVSDIAAALSIGRGSVYRALEGLASTIRAWRNGREAAIEPRRQTPRFGEANASQATGKRGRSTQDVAVVTISSERAFALECNKSPLLV